ncbi:zona pellucida sperm-binding protein 3 isoform X1 [Pangasianodon hypophthalmus]|uniref:zona pellucida sperm-binding protein 3 isoform X1 n=1 Tax=Pangasianodon hypophthalmus TaxID=310915 RepID=UPI002307BED4|nr:zona pellucida sperm-binding protein 3 isoform X1 [Pangasianodon hypophthalmus]
MIIRYNERLKSNRSPDVPLRTVSVTCSPSAMEVHIKADLFDLGVPVNPEHVTLGERCGVTKASSEEFIIHTALTDCGTRYWLTADALVYTNMLVYAPVPSVDGVIRQEKTSVPVECAYRRRFGVDSVSVVPTWLPHLSAHSAEHTLHFALRLMSADWQVVRGGVYFLGDMINMEASVFAPLLELRVFVQDCVATTTRDTNSVPRYKFIQNGCFTDGQQTNSTSQFLPRIQSDKLHLQLHTFIFRQVHSAQIFISCSLKAELQSSSSSRACSYIQGSWRSADGDHSVCESCRTSDQFRQNDVERRNTQAGSAQMEPGELELGTPGSMWKNPEHADTHVQALQQEVLAGPLSLSSWRSEVSPSAVLEGVHITHIPSLKTKRLTAHALQGNVSTPGSEYQLTITEEKAEWESRVSTEREMGVSLVTPTPELHLTVTPLMFTTLEMTNTVFKTKSTAAAGIPTLTANMTNHLPFITPPHHHRPSPGNLLLLLRMAPHSQPKVLGGCCGWYHTDTLKMVADGLTCIVERLHLLKTIYAQVSFIIQWITSI